MKEKRKDKDRTVHVQVPDMALRNLRSDETKKQKLFDKLFLAYKN